MIIQVMKQALEALEEADIKCNFICYEAKIALRAAIEAAERQEPVAVVEKYTGDLKDMAIIVWTDEQPPEGTKLYTTPQPAILAGLEIQVIMDAVRCHGSRLNNDEILSMLAAAPKLENLR